MLDSWRADTKLRNGGWVGVGGGRAGGGAGGGVVGLTKKPVLYISPAAVAELFCFC